MRLGEDTTLGTSIQMIESSDISPSSNPVPKTQFRWQADDWANNTPELSQMVVGLAGESEGPAQRDLNKTKRWVEGQPDAVAEPLHAHEATDASGALQTPAQQTDDNTAILLDAAPQSKAQSIGVLPSSTMTISCDDSTATESIVRDDDVPLRRQPMDTYSFVIQDGGEMYAEDLSSLQGTSTSNTDRDFRFVVGHEAKLHLRKRRPEVSKSLEHKPDLIKFDHSDLAPVIAPELHKRLHHFSGRTKQLSTLQHVQCYTPYKYVPDPRVRNRLLRLAKLFDFVDRVFAEYFQCTILPAPPWEWVKDRLEVVRAEITSKQSTTPGANSNADLVFLGDLGKFCESALRARTSSTSPPIFYSSQGRDDEKIMYIQASLEVPYWDLVFDFIARSHANTTTFQGDRLLRVLDSVKSDIKDTLRQLGEDLGTVNVKEAIGPILDGINARIQVLDSYTTDNVSSVEKEERLSTLSNGEGLVTSTAFVDHEIELRDKQKLSSMLTAVAIVTIALGYVPLIKGFAISSESTEKGSLDDADYWYNLSQAIAVVMGSLMTILSLRKQAWLSQEYVIVWFFLAIGVLCAIFSVVVYSLCNTRWSSLLAAFSTTAGFGATLAMTMTDDQGKRAPSGSSGTQGKAKTE
ncbi:hypothetical protein VTL71DRAFT_3572 [Oculimacula yallundae]|uniref:Uncharacterized protein n=1 Tax=Oculimacula yallundae TaxID=86028 RepID=A0ABR4C7J7_9HELO